MLSPFSSTLAKLDDSLQTIQTQIGRLREGLGPNEDQLRRSLADACHCATMLGDMIGAQRSKAKEIDDGALDRLIHELKLLRRTVRRRLKLLDLAMELHAGRVRHHRINRTEALNALRLRAVRELRGMVAHSSQEADLPGPAPSKWMHWACGLQEKADAAALQVLRRDFTALEEFIADMEDRYWVSGQNRAAEFSSAETEVAEESAAELLPVPALAALDAEAADHDRLARDLLAIFEKSLYGGGADVLSRSHEQSLREASPSPDLGAVSTGDPSPDPAMVVPPTLEKRNAEHVHTWVELADTGGIPLMPPAKRLEKARIDKAASLDFMKVVNAWQLDDGQARRLLGISRALFRQLREGEPVNLEPEKLTRISLLVAIAKGLNVLYGTRRGEKWVHRRSSNPLFDGTEPLAYMLKEGVEGLLKVRELVGVWSGYISPEKNS